MAIALSSLEDKIAFLAAMFLLLLCLVGFVVGVLLYARYAAWFSSGVSNIINNANAEAKARQVRQTTTPPTTTTKAGANS